MNKSAKFLASYPRSQPKPPTDMPAGKRFHRLTIVGTPHRINGRSEYYAECLCDCGSVKPMRVDHLRYGQVKSCGCWIRNWWHGHSRVGKVTPTYRTWMKMRARCFDDSCPEFELYGGRGITICDRWRRFEYFLADMGERPHGTCIGRINNDGNYEPENCRWETPAQQARNTRRNRFITYNGITLCMKDWSNKLGIKSLAYRLKHGWPLEKALNYGVPRT